MTLRAVSYRRGYLAGRAQARRGRAGKLLPGRPRKPHDPFEYECGYTVGLNARKGKPQPRCANGCGCVVLTPGTCGFCRLEAING